MTTESKLADEADIRPLSDNEISHVAGAGIFAALLGLAVGYVVNHPTESWGAVKRAWSWFKGLF